MVTAAGYLPDTDAIRADLVFMTRRWHELPRACMFELRSFAENTPPEWEQFTVERLGDAVNWAASQNLGGRNVYVVRNPIRIEHRGPADDASIAAAFFCWADCDDPASTDNVRRFEGPRWSAAVTTGRVPSTRVHLYWELEEPCANMNAWKQLQISIAAHFGSDRTVINPSRIMRLGGTVSFPASNKRKRGYIEETCTIRTEYEDDRDPVKFDRLLRVFGATQAQAKPDPVGFRIDTGTPEAMDRERARIQALSGEKWHEAVIRLVGSYVSRGLSDAEIHSLTDPLTLAGYTVEQTRKEVQAAIDGARRKGFAPDDTDPYEHEKREAEEQAKTEPNFDADPDEEPADRDLTPVDLWGVFPSPELPRGLLPKVIEDFAIIQGEQMGADPGGLAAAALCVCCAAIPDDVKVRVKRYEDWHESARIWVALVGDPSTKKSPVLSAAERPLRAIDANLYKDYIRKKVDYDALKKDEKAEAERPRQTRKRLEDTTIEAAQEVMADSPDGVLIVQDELSGWFGGMDRYSNGKGRDRSFWLQAFNGGVYAYNRVGRGAGMVDNLSACVLGGIQPEPIRGIVADAHDDGLIQRLFPIILKPARLGSEDSPPTDAVRAYGEAVAALTRVEVMRPVGVIDVGDRARLIFSDGAQRIRRELEEKHLALMAVECVSRKLAAHIGKYDGLFARLCVAFHAIENAHSGMIPTMIGEDTARRVAEFLHRFFLRHALAFYNGVLSLSDDHDRLTAIAGYILAHKLEIVSARDVARGDRTMRKLAKPEVIVVFEQLEALGWVSPQPMLARSNAPLTWVVNPEVHRLFIKRAAEEATRRAQVSDLIREAARDGK